MGDYKDLFNIVRYEGVLFQDLPFSFTGCHEALDKEFPDAKFILTVRDSPETWHRSVTSYHSKPLTPGRTPAKEDMQEADYCYKGFIWEVNQLLYKTPEDDPYHKETLMAHYQEHNRKIIEYFEDKPGRLLVVDVKDEGAAERICRFVGSDRILTEMPWENRT